MKKLQKEGYSLGHSVSNNERKFFWRTIKYAGEKRSIHTQLIYRGSHAWISVIAVRNYLRKHQKVAQEYARIKKDASKYAKGEGEKYRKYKKPFLDRIEKLALKD